MLTSHYWLVRLVYASQSGTCEAFTLLSFLFTRYTLLTRYGLEVVVHSFLFPNPDWLSAAFDLTVVHSFYPHSTASECERQIDAIL